MFKYRIAGVLIGFLLISFPTVVSSVAVESSFSDVDVKFENQYIENETYDLVIISSSYYLSDVARLRDHKNSTGIASRVVAIEDIYDGVIFPLEGRDQPEQIKYFLKNALDSWDISYVLLFGSTKIIPTRWGNVIPFEDEPYNYTSELYYADIYDSEGNFSTWDQDNDSRFLEWYNQSLPDDNKQDLIPEIAVGRISFSFPYQAKLIISKIINYESKICSSSWYNTMVVAGGDSYSEYEGPEGEIHTQIALDIMTGFTPKKLWASNGELDRFGLSILRAINKGCGFLYLEGHGTANTWGTFDSEHNPLGFFSTIHTLFLFNVHKLPVCILGGCHVNKIEKDLCIGSAFLQRGVGGTIATIGLTQVGYYGFQYNGSGLDFLELQFFREYANGSRILGDIWKACLTKSMQANPINWNEPAGLNSAIDAKMISEWIILGDPSLRIGGCG